MWKHRGESLVVSGCNDRAVQIAVNALNAALGNIGKTIDLTHPSLQRSGDDQAMLDLVEKMNRSEVRTLFMLGVNPAYDYHDPARFLSGLEKVALSVSFSDRRDETSSRVHAVCPDHHFLEAWGDAEAVESHFSLAQPLIAPLFNTRDAQASLLKWLGHEPSDYHTYLREFWQKNIFSRQHEVQDFQSFWDQSLQNGWAILPLLHAAADPKFRGNWKAAITSINDEQAKRRQGSAADHYELQLNESVALRDGRHANNPWLQELPDPISKVTWGNYAAMAPATAAKLQLNDGDVVRLKPETGQMEAPVFIQPGQHAGTISVALGYGRSKVGRAGQNVGVNAYPLVRVKDGHRLLSAREVTLEKTGRSEKLATTQTHFSMEGRPIVLETSLEELHHDTESNVEPALPTLWAARLEGEHAWGMAIDMNACTGCSACVVACQAENNVPVVGKDQIERIRIMHWIRH